MSGRKISRFTLVTYFAIYICLLVPGHLAAFACGPASPITGLHQTDRHFAHHDSRTCHICLSGGQLAALGISCCFDAAFYIISTIDEPLPISAACLSVDHILPRAPPSAL
jgi:hypothetical protein